MTKKQTFNAAFHGETEDPFQVVNIKKITKEAGEFRLKVSLFYRPEDTHKGSSTSTFDNILFCTEEEATECPPSTLHQLHKWQDQQVL